MAFTASDVKNLREATGAGMMDCKKALEACNGDFEASVKWLREKGIASAAKRTDRATSEGAIASYIHMGGKVGVLVEINCETDFVAKTDDFQQVCRDICLHICSSAPQFVRREDVPAATIAGEMAIYKKQAEDTGKPANVAEKIAEGKLNKWYSTVCLLEQEFVKDPDRTIDQLIKELSGKVGENIQVKRFARFQLGEAVPGASTSGNGEDN